MSILGFLGWLGPLYLAADWISDGKLNGSIKFGKKSGQEDPAKKQKEVKVDAAASPPAPETDTQKQIKFINNHHKELKYEPLTEAQIKQLGAGGIKALYGQYYEKLYGKRPEEVSPSPSPPTPPAPAPVPPQPSLDKQALEKKKALIEEKLEKCKSYKTKLFEKKNADAAILKKKPKMYAHLTRWANDVLAHPEKLAAESKPENRDPYKIKLYYRDRQDFFKKEFEKFDKTITDLQNQLKKLETSSTDKTNPTTEGDEKVTSSQEGEDAQA